MRRAESGEGAGVARDGKEEGGSALYCAIPSLSLAFDGYGGSPALSPSLDVRSACEGDNGGESERLWQKATADLRMEP